MSGLGIALTAAVMVLGLVGTVVPVWPGLGVVWAAGLVYGVVAGFGAVGAVAFTVMTVLAIAGTVATVVLPHRGGAARGAPTSSLLAGLVGAVVGVVVLPVLGLPLGALAGVWLAEMARLGDAARAWRATLGVLRGFGLGVLVELGLGTVMIACWVVWVVVGG